MSSPFSVELDAAGNGRVSGRINVSNATRALSEGTKLSKPSARTEVDLKDLESADSVTLAVLLAWAAAASRKGGKLVYRGIPERLRAIAHLGDAEPLLGIAP